MMMILLAINKHCTTHLEKGDDTDRCYGNDHDGDDGDGDDGHNNDGFDMMLILSLMLITGVVFPPSLRGKPGLASLMTPTGSNLKR